jgi:tetratricopeptide (TPR) repeat protein
MPPAQPPHIDDPAIAELDGTIRANPNDGAAYYKRGQLYAQHGDFGSAVKDFDEVLRLYPKDAEALNNRCWARAVLGELQPAMRDCDGALEIRPRYLDALDSRRRGSLSCKGASDRPHARKLRSAGTKL